MLTEREAAQRIGISTSVLRDLENDRAEPEMPVFERMQSVYGRTKSVLLLPWPPDTERVTQDHRGAGTVRPEDRTLLALRDARRFQRVISEIVALDPEILPLTRIGTAEQSELPEIVAAQERSRLGVSMATQFSWARQEEAFEAWRTAYGEAGIAVLIKTMPWQDCRGVSLSGDGLVPTIVVNNRDSLTAKCFTMAHEYAHLILREGAFCSLRPDVGGVENWCNQFAAAFLMPRDAVIEVAAFPRYRNIGFSNWEQADVRSFARRFKVSPYAAARRLYEVRVSNYYVANSQALFARDYGGRDEEDGGSGERAEAKAVREYGHVLASAVVEAASRGVIDQLQLVDAFRIGGDRLPDLDRQIERRRRN